MSDPADRYARVVTWLSVIAIVLAVAVMARVLPVDRGLDLIEVRIERLGAWAPAAYALLYAAAVVLLVPGSVLTLGAGALFGPVRGVVVVAVGATLGAILAFLIARYAARPRVARMIQGRPGFGAIDRAIGEGGWRIVALLRLTPVVPFNVLNYFLGLTAVGFRPYAVASAVFMLPATCLYVYLGHLGGEGLAAVSGRGSPSIGVWSLRGVGLLATVAAIVYVTRRARRILARHTDSQVDEPMQASQAKPDATHNARGRRRAALVTLTLAVLFVTGAGWVWLKRHAIRDALGPPPVVMAEAYSDGPASPTFDHGVLDGLLKKHVDADGAVDYKGLAEDADALQVYLTAVAGAPFDAMSRDEKLALLINAYNAFTLRLILDYYPVKSIKDIPGAHRWGDKRWNVGGNIWSLNEIEHEQIRPKFSEPRIHFALVCAAEGCPKLRREVYTGPRLDSQLDQQTADAHRSDRWFRFDDAADTVYLTRLYDWYGGDFEQSSGSVLDYAAGYAPALKAALDEGRTPTIEWLEYDWSLNEQP